MRLVREVLYSFYLALGMKINVHKSRFLPSKHAPRAKVLKFGGMLEFQHIYNIGRYLANYRGASYILGESNYRGASYTWQSLIKVVDYLKHGYIYRVCKGSISLWYESGYIRGNYAIQFLLFKSKTLNSWSVIYMWMVVGILISCILNFLWM